MYVRLAGALLIPLALALDAGAAQAAFAQAWPPFVLVAGLLLIGLVAGRDGLFDAAAARLVRLGGPPLALLAACFALVALVTALLNLDTSVVFLTPVLIAAARRRALDPAPFLYGSVLMANASSLFLPGSNLTNLLVLSSSRLSGAAFFTRMLPMALASSLVTAAGIVAIHRRALSAGREHDAEEAEGERTVRGEHGDAPAAPELGVSLAGALLAALLIVVLHNAALPVLAIGLLMLAYRVQQRRMSLRASLSWLGAPTLLALFGLSVALGTFARSSSFTADLLHSPGAPLTALVAALASVAVNNLPAAVLLSSSHHLPVAPLLLGLNVGPNLAVTGSLAVLLWWRAAVAAGITPSAITYSRHGLLLVPAAMLVALAVGGG